MGDASSNVEDFRMALLATLHEMPASVEIWDGAKSSDSSPALRVGASKKLNAMLELLLAGPEAPGTLTYDLRLVLFKNHAAVERMFNNNRIETAGIGGPALWNEESLPRLLKFLAEDSDVKLQASPTLRIAPGGEGVMSMQDSRHDIPFEDSNWTGQVCTIESHPAGGKTTINLNLKTQLAAANGGISTQELSNKTTLVLGSTFTAGGIINTEGEHMVFITARLPGAVPFGIVVTDQPGFLRSPYALGSGMIDVVGIPQGTKVKCPYTGQVFRIPE